MIDQNIDVLAARLKPHYSRFLDSLDGDILMTAHSHQAWPNASREGQIKAWDDAARMIDGKWAHVFSQIIPRFQTHIAKRIGSDRSTDIAIASNTHELVYRLLSCFGPTPKVVTSTSEFHSLRRQLSRLEEDGAKITWVDTSAASFVERFCEAIENENPDLVALSYVFFSNAEIVLGLPQILEVAKAKGCPVLVDLYHAFNTVELAVDDWPGDVFAVGGGYKYAQSGEGVCWMLLPRDSSLYRPRNTGWFADFEHLESLTERVEYGSGGQRFLGATFDPTSLYRANAVMDWMDDESLTVKTFRDQAARQTHTLIDGFEQSDLRERGFSLATPKEASQRASFVALRHPLAANLSKTLAQNGLRTDARNDLLRLGPGPYITRAECVRAIEIIQRRAV